MKKAQGLPITVIIVAALGIMVLVVIGAIFGGQIFKFGRAASSCPGLCVLGEDAEIPFGATGDDFTIRPGARCLPDFETELAGKYISKNMPSNAVADQWMCRRCCLPTG